MRQLLSFFALAICALSLSQFGSRLSAEEKVSKLVDDQYNFSVMVPAPWKKAEIADYKVPGKALAAFSGAESASVVVFVQEPGMAFDPRFIVDVSARAMEKKLEAKVHAKDVKTVAGKKAMWLVVEGKGTGGAIDGQGSVQTSQHWVAVPREKDVLIVLLTSPTSRFEENSKSFEKVLKTLTIGGTQTEEQSKSK
ncbi:MAG: hypothetical protein ACKO23_08960 [Gemmataceae bacterium]